MNARFRALIFSLGFLLSACSKRNRASIELSGLNYTHAWIAEFSIDGYVGHGISPNGGGGKFVCCITMPRAWHPGMKVVVRWTADYRVSELWKQKVVDVPRYTERDIGMFAVHFYPDDTVKVLVTAKIEGHPEYPYPRPN